LRLFDFAILYLKSLEIILPDNPRFLYNLLSLNLLFELFYSFYCVYLLYLGLFNITKAPITPGTHTANVRSNTINIDPQPLSNTAKGGKNMANKTLQKLIVFQLINILTNLVN